MDDKFSLFTCPKCGGHYFGRDTELENGVIVCLPTVRCHTPKCEWRGMWPLLNHEGPDETRKAGEPENW